LDQVHRDARKLTLPLDTVVLAGHASPSQNGSQPDGSIQGTHDVLHLKVLPSAMTPRPILFAKRQRAGAFGHGGRAGQAGLCDGLRATPNDYASLAHDRLE
jgi:hypothetical protein